MSDKRGRGGIFYLDAALALVGLALVAGQLHAHAGSAPALPLLRDLFGFWIPIAVAVSWLAGRRRTVTATATWPLALGALALLAGAAVVSWRWGAMPFVGAVVGASFVLAAGLALRARRISERPTRFEVFGLVTGIASVVLTLVLLEAVLWIVPGVFTPEIRQLMEADAGNFGVADPTIGYLHRPNAPMTIAGRDFHSVAHVDGLGFRNATWPWPAHADIVTVGDSLTFGYGSSDDEAWPAIVASSLGHTSLINLGLIGASPQQYERLYEKFGVKLHPKLLIVGFFGQNDFWDARMFDRWLSGGTDPNYMVWRDFGQPMRVRFSLRDPVGSLSGLAHTILAPVVRYSRLYHLLEALRSNAGTGEAQVITFSDGHRIQVFRGEFAAMRAASRPVRPEFTLALHALERMQALAGSQGTHVLVVLQPGKEETYLPDLIASMGDTTADLRPALDRAGIEYLDLGPAFRHQAAAGERLFYEVDGHPTAAGYALIARLVAHHVEQHAAEYGLAATKPALVQAGAGR
jgi:lysophospholipase L1-like esterase